VLATLLIDELDAPPPTSAPASNSTATSSIRPNSKVVLR
jgi:hypothetical protein